MGTPVHSPHLLSRRCGFCAPSFLLYTHRPFCTGILVLPLATEGCSATCHPQQHLWRLDRKCESTLRAGRVAPLALSDWKPSSLVSQEERPEVLAPTQVPRPHHGLPLAATAALSLSDPSYAPKFLEKVWLQAGNTALGSEIS